jgi:hypothetical protein
MKGLENQRRRKVCRGVRKIEITKTHTTFHFVLGVTGRGARSYRIRETSEQNGFLIILKGLLMKKNIVY